MNKILNMRYRPWMMPFIHVIAWTDVYIIEGGLFEIIKLMVQTRYIKTCNVWLDMKIMYLQYKLDKMRNK